MPPQPADAPLPDERAVSSGITAAFAAHKKWVILGIALLYLAAFNGQWRVGLDSAIYRGVGDSLAAGHGYTFGGVRQDQVYPGLPLLLAGLKTLFGPSVVPALIAMMAISALTLLVIYKLVRLHFPDWMAMTVVVGVALNGQFLQQSQEVMTDTPFLLGVVTTLWGIGRLTKGADQRWKSVALLSAGLALAALTRPTFWVLAGAMILVSVWSILTGPRRAKWAGAAGLSAVLLVAILWVALDPRTAGFNPLGGGYERAALSNLGHLPTVAAREARSAFGQNLTSLFFGEPMTSVAYAFSALLLLGAILLLRRRPLWGVFTLLTVLTTLLFSSVPRYYLMALPLLWAGWLLLLCAVARRVPKAAAGGVLDVGILLVLLLNTGRVYTFLAEQHARDFLATYKKGSCLRLIAAADLIRANVPPGGHVLGPYGSILTYYSGRPVFGDPVLLRRGRIEDYPAIVEQFDPVAAVFPAGWYDAKDPVLRAMMRRNVVVQKRVLATAGDAYLATIHLTAPPGDWRKLPDHRPRRSVEEKLPDELGE